MGAYLNGVLNGMARADSVHAIVQGRADREADASIASWQSYAGQLEAQLTTAQQQLADKEGELVASVAGWWGDVAAQRQLREALAQVNPNHPLLAKEALAETKNAAAIRYAAEQGYDYNAATRGVRRR